MPFLNRLNRLSDIKKSSDIFGKCSAISYGIYCPTFGIAVSAPLINDAAVIVIGTPECTWYAKNSCIYHGYQPAFDRFYCLTMDECDIAFGDHGDIKKAVCQVASDTGINCVILASTCIPEIIGDDIDAIAYEAAQEAGIPVLPVHISHYDHKCYEFGVAISRTLQALGELMVPVERKPMTVNLLGRNFHSSMDGALQDTELYHLLQKYGVEFNLILPDQCSTEEIRCAPRAALNIVTHFVGVDLAVYMDEKFGTPYVSFEPSLEIDDISRGYEEMQCVLGIDMQRDLMQLRMAAEASILRSKPILKGKSFVNAGRPPDAIEAASFLVDMGMKPLLINAARYYDSSTRAIKNILKKGWNPYVNYVANPDAVRSIIPELSPDLYISHGRIGDLEARNIPQIEMLIPPGVQGFEAIIHALSTLTDSLHGGGEHETI